MAPLGGDKELFRGNLISSSFSLGKATAVEPIDKEKSQKNFIVEKSCYKVSSY